MLRAKKHAKMKTKRPDSAEQTPVAEIQNRICESETGISAGEKNDEVNSICFNKVICKEIEGHKLENVSLNWQFSLRIFDKSNTLEIW